ncbi:MAG: Fe-S cluster protein [Calditrichaeota bacterium]|nr:MAG: Fe-S cluster protein [Calditrichota bacterium]
MLVILTAIGAMTGLTIALAILLVIANKKLYVYEDPRIDIVEDMLPHANCGACGFPGCRPFAEALVNSETNPGKCTVSSPDGLDAIAGFLGVDAGSEEKRVARLACAGGKNVARSRAAYTGINTCRAAAQVAGGGKVCSWGCLGLADCEVVCDFDAISMNRFGLPVVDEEKCTACGDCVDICPKDLFSLHAISHRLWVNCKSLASGDEILEYCEVGCTACGRCAMDSENNLIVMENNLPVVDYSKNSNTKKPIQRCPTGAIVWLQPDGSVVKGEESPKVLRKSELPPVSS